MERISNFSIIGFPKNKQDIPSFDDSVNLFINLQEKMISLFTENFEYHENKTEPKSGSMIVIFFNDEKQSSDFYDILMMNLNEVNLGYLEIQDIINIIFSVNRRNRFKIINIAISNN